MKNMNDEIKQGISDWLSIIDYSDKEQAKWCRKNITALRKQLKNSRKGKYLS